MCGVVAWQSLCFGGGLAWVRLLVLVDLDTLRLSLLVTSFVGTLLLLFLVPGWAVLSSFPGLSVSALVLLAECLGLKLVPVSVNVCESRNDAVSTPAAIGARGEERLTYSIA